MKRVVSKDKAFNRDFTLLTSIDGVDPITTLTVVAEIGDLRRFERARRLPALRRDGLQVHWQQLAPQ
jgi:transposase